MLIVFVIDCLLGIRLITISFKGTKFIHKI